MSRARWRNSSSLTEMAAGSACSSAVDGNSVDDGAAALGLRLGNIVARTASAAAATTGSRRGSVGAAPSSLSVTIVCFLGVLSFLISAFWIAFARARSVCHVVHCSFRLETKLKRGFKSKTTVANENFVERNNEMRKADIRTTTEPVRLNEA